MVQFATILMILAVAGAIASWIAGAMFAFRSLGPNRTPFAWLSVAAWPMVRSRLSAVSPAQASNLNKALVAFIACVTVAFAATSVATNLSRLSR